MKIREDTGDFTAIGQRTTCASICTRPQILLFRGFRDFASGAKQCQDGHVQNKGLTLTKCKEQRVNIHFNAGHMTFWTWISTVMKTVHNRIFSTFNKKTTIYFNY